MTKINSRKSIYVGLSIALLLLMGQVFTNCSQPVSLLVRGSTKAANDKEMLSRLRDAGTWKVLVSGLDQSAVATTLVKVDSARPGVVTLRSDSPAHGPAVIASADSQQNEFQFGSTQYLLSSPYESDMVHDTYTIVVMVDAGARGRIFTMNNGTPLTQELSLEFTAAGIFRVNHLTTSGNSVTVTHDLRKVSGPVVLGVSFGVDSTAIAVQVDGTPITDAQVTTGAPGESAYLLRQLMIGDSSAGSATVIGEINLFTDQLTPATMNTVVRYVADRFKLNGMNYIPQPPYVEPPPPVDPVWDPVRQILGESCGTCHGPGATYSFVGLSKKALANSKWVVKGDASSSLLYNCLLGPVSTTARMPKDLPELTLTQSDAIKTWINTLQ